MTVRTIPGKVVYNGQEAVIVKKVTFADVGATSVTIGTIPANSIVTAGGVVVTTAFDGTTPILDIGTSADTDGFATDLALGTAGNIVADTLNASDDLGPYTAETTIVGVLAGTTVTAGVGYVYVKYIPLAAA